MTTSNFQKVVRYCTQRYAFADAFCTSQCANLSLRIELTHLLKLSVAYAYRLHKVTPNLQFLQILYRVLFQRVPLLHLQLIRMALWNLLIIATAEIAANSRKFTPKNN